MVGGRLQGEPALVCLVIFLGGKKLGFCTGGMGNRFFKVRGIRWPVFFNEQITLLGEKSEKL